MIGMMNDSLLQFVNVVKLRQQKIVATNGCFDILHIGHIEMLSKARSFGDVLIVGLNSDSSVKRLKGETRPINNQGNRKRVLEALRFVDFVHIFEDITCDCFLECVKPDVYVKAGDYSIETLNAKEKDVLLKHRVEIRFVDFVNGVSSTNILKRLSD